MKVGDTVSWESQAGGSWTVKTGRIIAEVPAGESATFKVLKDAKTSHIKYGCDKSVYDRVLVAVSAGKYGQIVHYYCLLKSVLEAQRN